MHRNEQFGAGLLLFDVESSAADVLRPHTDHVASTLPGIEQKGQRQPGARAYGMAALELGNFVVRPTMVAPGPDAYGPYLAGRIVGT